MQATRQPAGVVPGVPHCLVDQRQNVVRPKPLRRRCPPVNLVRQVSYQAQREDKPAGQLASPSLIRRAVKRRGYDLV